MWHIVTVQLLTDFKNNRLLVCGLPGPVAFNRLDCLVEQIVILTFLLTF